MTEAEFHRARTLFAIHKGKVLHIAGTEKLTHHHWFETLGLPSDTLEKITRGFLDQRGLFAYTGRDFKVTPTVEEETITLLPTLIDQLGIDTNLPLHFGMIPVEGTAYWESEKQIGTITQIKTRLATRIKALSLHQPWATLLATGSKRVETRSWNTDYRGWIAIHATLETEGIFLHKDKPFYQEALEGKTLPTGAFVGITQLYHTERTTGKNTPAEPEASFGNYTPNRYMWRTKNPLLLKNPIPCRGQRLLWNLPNHIKAQLPISPCS